MVRLHPLFALGLRDALEHGAVGVAAHEPGLQAASQLVRLGGQRPPRQVAAGDDQGRLLALDLLEDGCERGRVPVDVGDDCDPLHVYSTILSRCTARTPRGRFVSRSESAAAMPLANALPSGPTSSTAAPGSKRPSQPTTPTP